MLRHPFRALYSVAAWWMCAALLNWAFSFPTAPTSLQSNAASASEAEIDAALERAATAALGEREGTIIILDPQNGRVRAVVNPEIAFEQSFPPGSTIKPFTTLTALRDGLIDEDSRTLCREHFIKDDFETTCSHPKDLAPLRPVEALAYSCNYYFARLGERLDEKQLDSTLASFGFGEPTGVSPSESAGSIRRSEWKIQSALGEGEHMLATPIQLITAYSALVNGGRLFNAQRIAPDKIVPKQHAYLNIDPKHRTLIMQGMRGAVRYGTAEHARLHTLPLYVFGKTGTSTVINGFRTQGWFVGFASDAGDITQNEQPAPDRVKLAVLVFLKRAHGVQSAELSRPIFEEYARLNKNAQNQSADSTLTAMQPASPLSSPETPTASSQIRVHLVRENITRTVSLEDYVLSVVAAEGSVEDEPEALKALAVIVRSYALKNAGRHGEEGYDFCNMTHCQRFASYALDENLRAHVSERVQRAVKETAGEALVDERGSPVEAYFHAACGGHTADEKSLWNAAAPAYLRGVRDDYCEMMPHRHWVDRISTPQLLKAMRSDARTSVGASLRNVTITKRDATGRAELILLEGDTRRIVNGWDFKIIVGRALGWNLLKSSRFEIQKEGTDYLFHGSGFGHGLGLCQNGAHVMARRGSDYSKILNFYFPGTSIGKDTSSKWKADLLPRLPSLRQRANASTYFYHDASQQQQRSLTSGRFRIRYPARVEQREIEEAMRALEAADADISHRLALASLRLDGSLKLEIVFHETTGDFVGTTGQPWWAAAATRGRRIELQPVAVLRRRRVLASTLRHEFVHAVIDSLSMGRAPRWLSEGLAIYAAGEGAMISRYAPKDKLSIKELEERLAQTSSQQEMRSLYAAAYREVATLIQTEGESRVWQRITKR
ncbi:MAG: SpoIID/LytB domain-containing protein [Pyrinomonadaceae bacterium]